MGSRAEYEPARYCRRRHGRQPAGQPIVAAVVMLCVGARRTSRAADHEPILLPVRAGLLFITKF
jgi:hypothetical protein